MKGVTPGRERYSMVRRRTPETLVGEIPAGLLQTGDAVRLRIAIPGHGREVQRRRSQVRSSLISTVVSDSLPSILEGVVVDGA